MKRDRSQAEIANKSILEKINYGEKNVEEWDQEYMANFGMLKKASVLFSFRRFTDSFAILEKLKNLVLSTQSARDEKFFSLDAKWRSKLNIPINIPKDILNYNITDEVLLHFNLNVPLSTMLVYAEKMRKGTAFSIYNRHTFLNNQILEFHQFVTKKLDGYKTDYKNIKTQLSEYKLWGEKKEKLKTENPTIYKKYSQLYKAEMCPNLIKNKHCPESYRNCKFAHNSNQLNLTLVNKKVKLLENTLKETQKKTKSSETIVPWSYPRQNMYEQKPKFNKRKLTRNSSSTRSKSQTATRSMDLKKMKIRYHEV